jgi:hypothetical protein
MKALTLWPLWAMLVRLKLKRIETRDKRTIHRGPLAIHASLLTDNDVQAWETMPVIREALMRHGIRKIDQLIFGSIVAVVDVVDIFQTGPAHAAVRDELLRRHGAVLDDEQRAFGDYAPGRYGWILDNIRPLEKPIQARGWPGMWTVPDPVRVLQQLEVAA